MTKQKATAYPVYLIGNEKKEFAKLIRARKQKTGLRVGRLLIDALKRTESKGDINGAD